MKITKYFFLVIAISFSLISYGQKSNVSISNIEYSIKDISVEVKNPNDPNIDTLLVTFTLYGSNLSDIDTVSIHVGSNAGGANLVNHKLFPVKKGDKDFMNYKGFLYPIEGGKVVFIDVMSKSRSAGHNFVTISGKDKKGGKITEYRKQMR